MKHRASRRLLLGAAPALLLASCGQSTPLAGADPYAGGASYPWSYTAPAGKLTTLSLTPGENNLYYEPILAARNGWGPVEIDRSNGERFAGDGRALTLNGKTYQRGFGTHAGSELRFSLKGTGGATCTRFTADVGVDDEVGSRGSVVFEVYLDGARAYSSGTLTGAGATKRVDLDITGKSELRLVVTDAGDNIHYDHADWAQPLIRCVASGAPAPGSLDTSFGRGGRSEVGGTDAQAEPGGAVLISDSAGGDFVLKRLFPDGRVQQVQTDLGAEDAAYALARQSDGRVVVVGRSGNNFAAARYNADLSLDATFGSGGKVVTDLGSLDAEVAYAVALQPDGQIVLAGTTVQPVPEGTIPSRDLAVVRYTAGGQLDPSFGRGGVVVQRFDGLDSLEATEDEARAVAIQPDGRILIAGKADDPGGGRQGLLTRLTAAGALDLTFAGRGFVRSGAYSIYNGVALEPDGEIVVVGYDGRFFSPGLVQRYRTDGSLQGQAAVEFTARQFGNENILSDVLIQPDGRVLVGGRAITNDGTGLNGYALARLNTDLSLDTTFGTGGKINTGLGAVALSGAETPLGALVRQEDGRIVVVSAGSARFWP
ncbi:NPCBM/NEW2 domain-containing protein [Deinococcus budaensis]|uniref:Putative delta-60 repeat protein n=1 Tax=Deinococcus budaensis TaxID=1665626 RepID=A0A7W8LPS0_9DEIO|nr:NPCBM/NEW2 domain-containing protein [Deinococcus budaensis]MBB5234063.1 putative delta-60 repeat protein [Deinococcus budaensis]